MNDENSLQRAAHILKTSDMSVSESNLALSGDKCFMFSESGLSFLMYGKRGRNWIALGSPIGQRSEAGALIEQFLETARKASVLAAFYAVRERNLEFFTQPKLKSQKIGEMALVRIEDFSLEGKEKARFRQARNRAIREGVTFEVVSVDETSSMMDKIAQISSYWLKQQAGQEKGFSLGRFDRKILANKPIAIAKKNDEIIAFSNLWVSPDNAELSLDLMRYVDGHMVGVIDYLLVETMVWGSVQGYKYFSLGMAPLAGLDKEDHRTIMSYLCRFAYKHGDKIYGFQGIRQFKKKFNPEWESVYLLAPSQRQMPKALKSLALLSAGSLWGLVK